MTIPVDERTSDLEPHALPKGAVLMGPSAFSDEPLYRVPFTKGQKQKTDAATTGKERDQIRHAAQRAAENKYRKAFNRIHGYWPFRVPRFVAVDPSEMPPTTAGKARARRVRM